MVIGMITGTDITIMMTIVRIRMIMITTTTISDGGYGSLKQKQRLKPLFFYLLSKCLSPPSDVRRHQPRPRVTSLWENLLSSMVV
jgi:hypothetical protein